MILLRVQLKLKHLLSHQVMPDLMKLWICLLVRIYMVSQDIVIKERSKALLSLLHK